MKKKTQTFTNKNMRSNTLLQSNSHLRHVMLNKLMHVGVCMYANNIQDEYLNEF